MCTNMDSLCTVIAMGPFLSWLQTVASCSCLMGWICCHHSLAVFVIMSTDRVTGFLTLCCVSDYYNNYLLKITLPLLLLLLYKPYSQSLDLILIKPGCASVCLFKCLYVCLDTCVHAHMHVISQVVNII